jgi:ribosomal protein S18 acetylase RimI-like enzyme
MAIHIRPATAADVPDIAGFIAQQNARADRRCLHCGDTPEDVMRELAELGLPPEQSIRLALADGGVVGLIGADLALDVARGWLWGPYVDAAAPGDLADRLVAEFLSDVPPEIRMFDSFLVEQNPLNRSLERHGFRNPRLVHIYRADRPESRRLPAATPQRATTAWLDPMTVLHEQSFPNTWRSAAEMIDAGEDTATFVETIDGRFAGYIHVEVERHRDTGHVHFLAITEERRGEGLGRKLLAQGLDWAFEERALPTVHLTVLDNLANARSLYESMGFRLRETGVTLRREAGGI